MLGSPCGRDPGLFSLAAHDIFQAAAVHEEALEVPPSPEQVA